MKNHTDTKVQKRIYLFMRLQKIENNHFNCSINKMKISAKESKKFHLIIELKKINLTSHEIAKNTHTKKCSI